MKRTIILFIFLLSLLELFKPLTLSYLPDFTTYYESTKLVLSHKNPYELLFVYPPPVFFLTVPFSFFPPLPAEKLWMISSILLLILSLKLVLNELRISLLSEKGMLLCSLIFLFYFPLKFTLGTGQLNLFILFLITLSFLGFMKKDNRLLGISLGVAVMIKIFPLFLLPYLLLRRKWKALLWFFATCAFLSIASFIFFPTTSTYFVSYFREVLPQLLLKQHNAYYYNQALSGFVSRLNIASNISQIVQSVISLMLFLMTLFAILANKKESKTSLEFSLVLILNLLLNGFSWQHHFVWLLIPFLIIFFAIKRNIKLNFLLLLSFSLVSVNIAQPRLFSPLLQSHVFYGTLLLFGLNVYLLLSRREKN